MNWFSRANKTLVGMLPDRHDDRWDKSSTDWRCCCGAYRYVLVIKHVRVSIGCHHVTVDGLYVKGADKYGAGVVESYLARKAMESL